MNHKTKVGELKVIPCGQESDYYFELENEDYIKLKWGRHLAEIPHNIKIALCMNENYEVCVHDPFYTVLS